MASDISESTFTSKPCSLSELKDLYLSLIANDYLKSLGAQKSNGNTPCQETWNGAANVCLESDVAPSFKTALPGE